MAHTSTGRATNELSLYVLGTFRIEGGSREFRLPTRKIESLLAFLALHPQAHAREKIAALFWGDSTDDNARASLRVALNNLRKLPSPDVVLTDRETVQINPQCPIWVDAREFERLAHGDPHHAIELYRGDLLADFYDEWIFPEREHLRKLYLDALLQLTQRARASSDYARAIDYAQRLVACDPSNEQAHQHLIFCHIASGNRHAALEQYQACERALQTELSIAPAPETVALYEWVKQTPREQRSQAARLTNVPIPLTRFIGRQKEIVLVKDMLARARLLTLTGAGGCGKTRLAIQVAMDLMASSVFNDGVWWVDLAPLMDESLVPQAVAQVLGVRSVPHEALSETLANQLYPKTILLVLDNCEHLVGACVKLADELLNACLMLKILTTSREALGLTGEMVWRVPSLSLPDPQKLPALDDLGEFEAIRLFVERAEAVNPGFALNERNVSAVTQVCHRLDGIPLAIELAAARTKVLTAQQIAARLDDRFNLLTIGSRTALPRQQTLRAMIEWGYELLTEPERGLLRQLSVFVGGFSLDAIENICAGEQGSKGAEKKVAPLLSSTPAPLLDLLSRLVDKSLVVTEERDGAMRYRLLETLRQYSAEKLQETGEVESVRHRHVLFFAELGEQAERGLRGLEMRDWLDRLEIEHGNFRAALEWSVEHESSETSLRFADALGTFWARRGHIAEGRTWLERLLERGTDASAHLRAKAMVRLGWLAFVEGDYPQARYLDETSLTLFRAVDDKFGIVDALNQLGLMANYENDVRRSNTYFTESLALCEQTANRLGRAVPMIYRAQALLFQNQWSPQVKAMCEQGLELLRELDDKASQNTALLFLGLGAHFEGDDVRAVKYLEEAVALGNESGDKRRLCWALLISSLVLRWVNRIEEGLARAKQGMVLAREIMDKTAILNGFHFYMHLWVAQNQMERAARLMGAESVLSESIGFHHPPMVRTVNQPALDAMRVALGETRYNFVFAEGQTMSFERAIAYALEK